MTPGTYHVFSLVMCKLYFLSDDFFSYGSLTLYDGDSNLAPILGKYCGPFTLVSDEIYSSSNQVLVNYQSDNYKSNGDGFELRFYPHGKQYFFKKQKYWQILPHTVILKDRWIKQG